MLKKCPYLDLFTCSQSVMVTCLIWNFNKNMEIF